MKKDMTEVRISVGQAANILAMQGKDITEQNILDVADVLLNAQDKAYEKYIRNELR